MGMILIELDPKNFEYLDLIEPTDRLAFKYSFGWRRVPTETLCARRRKLAKFVLTS